MQHDTLFFLILALLCFLIFYHNGQRSLAVKNIILIKKLSFNFDIVMVVVKRFRLNIQTIALLVSVDTSLAARGSPQAGPVAVDGGRPACSIAGCYQCERLTVG